ncbi:MAG: hypothetical protein P3X22_000955 [Thermoprotei archaeon]|nr:hypothetical protein [Thermoprotei archaeon]
MVVAFLVFVSVLGLGFTGFSQSSQLEDPFGLLGLKAEYEHPFINLKGYSEFWFPLPYPPSPLLLAKYRFLLEEILSPDKKWYSYLKRMRADDPDIVSSMLDIYVREIKDPEGRSGRRENFYYRFSWHVTGYDGSYYTVILKFKMYYYDFVEMKPIYEFSEVREVVKVSVFGRRIIYNGVDVGVWPFWLMPWERFVDSKVKLAEVSPFFELNNVTSPIKYFNLTFEATVRVAYPSDEARYLRDVLGIVPERVLSASTGARYVFSGEDGKKFGDLWLEAYMKMLRKYYPQLSATERKIIGDWRLLAPSHKYDSVTGAALSVFGINDVFLTVIPLEREGATVGYQSYLIVSLTREPPSTAEETTATATTPTVTETTPQTTTTTTTPQEEARNYTTPPIGGRETPTETRTEFERETTVQTPQPVGEQASPAAPPWSPPGPPRTVEARRGLLSSEMAMAALTLIVLTVSAAVFIIASRRGVRG